MNRIFPRKLNFMIIIFQFLTVVKVNVSAKKGEPEF